MIFGGVLYRHVFGLGGGNLDVVAQGAARLCRQVFACGGQDGFVGRTALCLDEHFHAARFAANGARVGDLGVSIDGVGFVGSTRPGSGIFFGMRLHAAAQVAVCFVFGGNGWMGVRVGGAQGFTGQAVGGGEVV